MNDDDWHLPHDYWIECQTDGSFVLVRHEHHVRHFRPGTTKRAIEAWCDAYETGRQAGLQDGLTRGRNALAGELRTLLQLD